jgi:hypothetical protein
VATLCQKAHPDLAIVQAMLHILRYRDREIGVMWKGRQPHPQIQKVTFLSRHSCWGIRDNPLEGIREKRL